MFPKASIMKLGLASYPHVNSYRIRRLCIILMFFISCAYHDCTLAAVLYAIHDSSNGWGLTSTLYVPQTHNSFLPSD